MAKKTVKAKPAAKKPVKKAAPKAAKKPAKPVAKKAAPKPAAKKAVKTAAKPVAKKAAPKPVAKKAAPKPVAKKTAKPVAKKAAPKPVAKKAAPKPVAKKAAPVAKPIAKPVAKKKEAPKVEVKPKAKAEVKKAAPVVKETPKPVVKKAAPEAKPEAKKQVEKKAVPETKKPEPVVVETTEAPVTNAKPAGKTKRKKTFPPPKPNYTRDNPEIRLGPVKILPPKREFKPQPLPAKPTANPDNRSRYSDEELAEFKELITTKLEASRNELKYLQEQISRSSEMGDDSDARFKGLEDGTSTSEREYLSQMASRQIQYIGHLEKALVRIENKTYGICRETGKLISKERLRAVPHATLSIEAKQGKG